MFIYMTQKQCRAKHTKYQLYLKSDEWQEVRKAAIRRAGRKCIHCGERDLPLHVHHKTYDRLGHEKPKDILVLCERCHVKLHKKLRRRKVPKPL